MCQKIPLVPQSKLYSTKYGANQELLFPLQAMKLECTVAEGVRQDINRFMQTGIIKDTTIIEFKELIKILEKESPSMDVNTGHHCYADGWKLWYGNYIYKLANEDGRDLPVFSSIDINIRDSVAICQMESGKYRYLDLQDMKFIGDEYDYAWHFSEGLAAVEKYGRIGFINEVGDVAILPKYRTEERLKKDHYRLAFHDGKIAVPNEELYYELVDIDGNNLWGSNSFPYVKWCKNGLIVKISKDEEWNTATPNEGYIRKTFKAEIDDIVVNHSNNDTIPIYNHYDISRIKLPELVPENDLSGVWLNSDDNEDKLYLGKYTSDFMMVFEDKNISGSYYFTLNDDKSCINLISSDQYGVVYRGTISDDSSFIVLDNRIYYKVRDL